MRTVRIRFTLVLLLCVGSISAKQHFDHRNRRLDSLERILATGTPSGEALILIHRDLMWGYREIDIEKSMYHALKQVETAMPRGDLRAVSDGYGGLGVGHYYLAQYDSALVYYAKGLEVAERMRKLPETYRGDDVDSDFAFLNGSIGNVHNIQGDYHRAIEHYQRALAIFEHHDWQESQAIAYCNIGEMYRAMDNWERAEVNFLKVDSLARLTADSMLLAFSRNYMSEVFLNKGEYDKALQAALEARDYYFAHPEEGLARVEILNMLARIHLDGYRDAAQAETHARQALQLAEGFDVPREKAASLAIISSVRLSRGEWRQARQSALEALAADNSDQANTILLYEILAKANARLGDAAASAAWLDSLVATQASWSNRHYQSALREMETRYETEKKESRIAALEDEKRFYIWMSAAIVGILLSALVAMFFIWLWSVQRKHLARQQIEHLQQEKLLVARQAMLDGEVRERTRLSRDLHDRMGGLLSVIKLHLADMKRSITPESASAATCNRATELLDESMVEMRRIAHHLMPSSLSNSGLKTAVSEFCASVPHARFSWYGKNERLDPKMELAIYRIAYELVNNAMKHSGATHIFVQIVRDPGRIALTVQDDGRGFDTLTTPDGMGVSNIRNLVASYGGRLDIESIEGQGTEINVEFEL